MLKNKFLACFTQDFNIIEKNSNYFQKNDFLKNIITK